LEQTVCREWEGAKTPKGYGTTTVEKKTVYVHRETYKEHFGEIPEGMVVRHTCDNPSCYEPTHLVLGTYQQNSQDMVDRKRSTQGERNKHAVLTEQDVLEIRKKYPTGNYLQRQLADEYNVTVATINDILKRRSWRHV
jgi:hypothetical protein